MIGPRERQSAFNAASRGQWEGFAPHRDRVTRLLLSTAAAAPAPRACVLGAGNGNDLDLDALLERFRELHLVDLDGEALRLGALRQGVLGRPGLVLHAGVDLTAMLDRIEHWDPFTTVGVPERLALAEWPARRAAPTLPGPFDLVASTCLLSQLIANARHALGETHTDFLPVVRAIRLGHLRLLAELTAPGGAMVLVADATSTDVVPDLAGWPEASLAGHLPRLAREGRLFHGADPAAILSEFRGDPGRPGRWRQTESIAPWRWRLHDRDYLVWALRARRLG